MIRTRSRPGGEALDSYHYVSGNLLAARDPLGLVTDASFREVEEGGETVTEITVSKTLEVYVEQRWGESAEAHSQRVETAMSELEKDLAETFEDYETEIDGHRYRVHFDIEVIRGRDQATANLDRDDYQGLNRSALARGVDIVWVTEARSGRGGASVPTSRVGPDGASPPRPLREDQYFGSVMIANERTRLGGGRHVGSHEGGHLFNLGEGYGDIVTQRSPSGLPLRHQTGTYPEDRGTVMGGNMDGGRAPRLSEDQQRAIVEFSLGARDELMPGQSGYGPYREGYRARNLAPQCREP